MKYSKELKAAANEIAQKWWNMDTTFGFYNLTAKQIAQDLATMKPLATGDVLLDIEGIELALSDLTDAERSGCAAGAGTAGMRAGASFFKFIADIAARGKEGGGLPTFVRYRGAQVEAWSLVREEFRRHPNLPVWRIYNNVVANFQKDSGGKNRGFPLSQEFVIRRFKAKVRDWTQTVGVQTKTV
jgi:hypothetical protein